MTRWSVISTGSWVPAERSSFIVNAVRRAIDELERSKALEAALGAISDSEHDWDTDPTAWFRAQRTDRDQLVG